MMSVYFGCTLSLYFVSQYILVLIPFLTIINCEQLCKGKPLMYNGRRCASTTVYHDGRKGACGCGPQWFDKQFPWNGELYTAAVNQRFFDFEGTMWCGDRCGECYELTPTGGYIEGQGEPPRFLHTITVMITNLCPAEPPNLQWCAQHHWNQLNMYGYMTHFDLENGRQQISVLGWDNPEVTYKRVQCTGKFQSLYDQCQCSKDFV
ncbi:hypothetical protein SNE40_010400 [Patella caerulea]|uniref:Cellulase n=2 Tax=Patella caerulea TaxID=87958 RepID=A0AAN8PRK7_PATCE